MPVILVADDDPMILKVVSRSLEKNGYRVVVAKDGAQAVRTTYKKRPDLIVLDASMPEMDGFDVLKELKATPGTALIPVLMLTARRTQKDIIAARSAGADGYLGKPFSVEDLLHRVEHLLK